MNGFLPTPLTHVPIDYANCVKPRGALLDAGDFAGQLLREQRMVEGMGWRITGFTSVYSARHGAFELVRKNKPMTPSSSGPVSGFEVRDSKITATNSSWRHIWGCLTHTPEPLDKPVWALQFVDYAVFTCVDGTVRMNYQFPVLICLMNVGFDGLYIYLLWLGRRRRKAAALLGSAT